MTMIVIGTRAMGYAKDPHLDLNSIHHLKHRTRLHSCICRFNKICFLALLLLVACVEARGFDWSTKIESLTESSSPAHQAISRQVAWKIADISRGGQMGLSSSNSSLGSTGSSITKKYSSSGWASISRFIPFLGRRKSISQIYRETLEEQVFLLDRQLHSVREEVAALRFQMDNTPGPRSTSIKDAAAAERVAAIQAAAAAAAEAKALRQQIRTLEQQAIQLEKMKNELEKMLEKEQRKVEVLERALTEQEQLTNALRERYEHQLEILQEELEVKTQEQIAQLQKLLEERVQQAAEAARAAALVIVERKVQEASERLRQQKAKELEQERKRSGLLIEQEKMKMRKLVKALANREKKLLSSGDNKERAARTSAGETVKTTSRLSSAEAAAQLTRKAPATTRGPI